MEQIAMILRKPPYGDINAAEAVRHALGAAVGDMEVSLLLIDGGVQLARRSQDDTGTGFTNLESTLKDCKEMGVGLFADHLSLVEHNLQKEDIVEGVEIVNESDIAAMLRKADATMIF